MTSEKELSPAAQAVLSAAFRELDYVPKRHVSWCAAAALREVINQCQNGQGVISAADLYLIATELEAQP